MLKETQREWYCDRIREQYYKSLPDGQIKAFAPPALRRMDEVIEALALGCTLSRPRVFRGRYMEAKDFRRIADKLDGNIMAVAVDALKKNEKTVKNRVWYILGILSRF